MSGTASTTDARVDEIRRAAIPVFAARGFKGTSMADIARAAGVSRPALYQYFENRAGVFRAAFEVLLNDATDQALAALEEGATLDLRLDGYLQRAFGDGYETLSATAFGAELMEAKHEFAADVAEAAHDRARRGLRRFLKERGVSGPSASAVIDLISLSPLGLKGDGPSPTAYRRRLTALAAAAAAMLASS